MSQPITILGTTTRWPTTGDTGYSAGALQTIQLLASAVVPISGLYNTTAPGPATTAILALNDSHQLTWTYSPGGPAPSIIGSVTSVSVVSANGFAGTVANASTTPAITLTTSVTGVLKGNGTAISAATAGTDYSVGTSALATGILKSTTTTGALSIAAGSDINSTFGSQSANFFYAAPNGSAGNPTFRAMVAADVPTLNQNTTGTAANATNVNLTNDVASATDYLVFSNTATGNQPLKTAASITVNPSTGIVTLGGVSSSGNITMTGNGRRLTADMSTATFANRFGIQSSVTNGKTVVEAVPNGTNQIASFQVVNDSNTTDSSLGNVQIDATNVYFASQAHGTGTLLPINIGVGNSLLSTTNRAILVDTSGNVAFGNNAALATSATDRFPYIPTMAGAPVGTPTTITGKSPIVVDSTNNRLYFYSGAAWRTSSAGAGTVTSVGISSSGTVTVGGGPITGSGTLTVDLPTTAVSAGSYTNTNITVDAYGRITSASNGTAGTVTAIGVTTANGVSGTSSGGSTPNLTITLGAITPSSVAATGSVGGTSLSSSGNLSFTGTGNRITGDFSNATVSNRVSFQSSITNGATHVAAIPNGSSNKAQVDAFYGSDPDNSYKIGLFASSTGGIGGSTPGIGISGINAGTGTAVPLYIFNNALAALTVDTLGNMVFGGAAALATNATDRFVSIPAMAGKPTGTPTLPADFAASSKAALTVDTTNNRMYFYSTSAWRRIGVPDYESAVATAAQTVFNTTLKTIANASGQAFLQVFVNGVKQMEGASKAYQVTGANQITFNAGVTLNSDVEFYGWGS